METTDDISLACLQPRFEYCPFWIRNKIIVCSAARFSRNNLNFQHGTKDNFVCGCKKTEPAYIIKNLFLIKSVFVLLDNCKINRHF